MVRLRLVGRPGRRFGNKGPPCADGGRSGVDGEWDGRKGRLVVSVHQGLGDFVAITGGDSDVEEGFRGFTDDDIQLVIKKTSEALALVRSSENINASSVDKIRGRLRQRVQKTTAKPFLQLVKSRYNRRSFLTSIPLAATKRHVTPKSFLASSMSESSSKLMKGSIKVCLVGKGFLVKKQKTRSLQSKEKSKSKEGKVPQSTAAALQSEKPRKKQTKIVNPKTVGRSVKDALLKQKQKRLTDHNRAARCVDLKYRLTDSRRQEKLSSESTESYPKKRGFVKCNSDTKTKSTFADQRKSVKALNRHARRMSESSARWEREGDKRLSRPFRFPSKNKNSRRKIMTSKEFPEDSNANYGSEFKKCCIHDTTFDERDFVADQDASDAKPGNLLLNGDVVPTVPKKIPVFDAPLICDSKRHRKPAQKLIMKWSEDYDLNLKRKSLDVSTAGIETSSGNETFDLTPKSAKNYRTAQVSSQSLSFDESHSLISKADLFAGHDGASGMPLSPNPVLMQKNKNPCCSWPERENSKTVRMRKYCCICLGSHKLSQYSGCRSLCCQHCFRFYSSKAKLVMKGSLDLLCISRGCCTIHWKTMSSCDACKYRKCLEYFLPPEEAVSMMSVPMGDADKRERHQSEFPLAPIAKDSPWDAELLNFLKASEVQEEFCGAQDKSKANVAGRLSATSLDSGLCTSSSRHLCKFGKSKTIVTKTSDISHEMIGKSDTSPSVLRIPNLLHSSFSDSSNFTDGVKLCEIEADERLKPNENPVCWTSQVGDSTGEILLRCEMKPCGARTLDADQPSENAPLIASPKSAAGGQQHSPEILSSKGLEVEGREGDTESEDSEEKCGGSGPRIKHVCRKAAMVLGKPPAIFPSRTELCLSALPSQEKERILQNEGNSQGSSDVDEANGISKEQMKDGADIESPSKKFTSKKAKTTKHVNGPKKTMRCRNCVGCLTPECGVCTACKDMPKNGGRGTLKHACIHRVCRNPILPWHKLSPEKLAKARLEKELEAERSVAGSTPKKMVASRLQTSSAFNRSQGRPRLPLIGGKKFQSKLSSFASSGLGLSKARHLRMPRTGSDDKLEKISMSNKPKTSVQLNSQTVKVDFSESADIETAWKRGVALYSSSSCSLRAACRLCGCVGLQELIYCSVCCQPFHGFCLEERDRPKDGCDTWCCLQCHFCHVCYGQSNLLQCNKCQESYHPDCLSPGHPTKPSRRKQIWVCSKCVRCRSCGATTPGHEKDAVWMCDFSLCYRCGLLMEKGKFCPVCRKCYTDDDWESEMIQCSTCHNWVHSKCEELTDEMHQFMTYMLYDLPFNCRVCCPSRPSVWEAFIKREMNEGMRNVLDDLVQSKLSFMLKRIKMESENSLLSTEDNGNATEKQNNGYDEHSGNITECLDEPFQIHFSVNNSDNRNSDAQVKPKDVHLPTGSSTSPAVPVTSGQDDETTGRRDLVKSNENLKTVASSDTEGIETSNATCTLIGDHCISSRGEGANEEEENVHDHRTSSEELVSPILDLNEVLLTVTALDNICPQYNKSSLFSSDGKLHSLLQPSKDVNKDPLKHIPCDLNEIRAKLEKENGYGSIEEFAANVASIIHYNVELKKEEDEEEEAAAVSLRTEACASLHTLFVKQMAKCFPWFNMKNSRGWSSMGQSPNNEVLDETVHPPSGDHTYAHWLEKEAIPPPPQPSLFRNIAKDCSPHFGNTVTKGDNGETTSVQPEDSRCCAFCWSFGDADEREAGRLVSAGQDDWVHVNCALWSAEVYKEIDGTLQMVHAALARSRKMRCDLCGRLGATVGCCQLGCNSNFHYPCARRKNCAFLETKKVFCELHWMAVDANLIADGNFAVSCRICVDQMSSRLTKRQWVMGIDPSSINILIGSLVVECLGRLSPLSDSKSALLPVDFCVSRLFWSTEDPRRRSIYVCRIFEVIPKAEAPEIINDMTVVHDRDDPSYDLALAMSFTRKVSEFDESTLSAVEDALDLSDNEIEAHESPNARDEKWFGSNLPQTLGNSVSLGSDPSVSGYPHQLGFSNSHVEGMNLEMPNKELSFSGVIKDNLMKSLSHSQLSASTLKMLQNKTQSDSMDNDDRLGKIKSQRNESAPRNRMQEFNKDMREGDGALSLCNYTDGGSSKIGEMSFDLARINETALFGKIMGRSETVARKNLVQMDGAVGESDSEGSGSEDLSLGAENERNWGPEGKDFPSVFPTKCSLPFASSVETDAARVKYGGSNANCVNSRSLVDSRFLSHYKENSTISNGIFSKKIHIMSDTKKTEENEMSTLSGKSVALNCNDASFKLPLLQHQLSLPVTLPTLPAADVLKTELGVLSDIKDGSLRSVVMNTGGLQPSTLSGLNSTLGIIAPHLSLPCASEGTTVISPQIRFALPQLLNSNSISYLGNMAANAIHLQQVVGNLQFPVHQQTKASSLFAHIPQPIAFGISSCPQIQVAPLGSLFPPLILQSLLRAPQPQALQPLFLRLSNCSSAGQPSLSGNNSVSFASPVNQMERLSTWPSTTLGMLPTQIRTEFANDFRDAILRYAGSETVRPAQPVSVGVKRHLFDGSEDVHSKRMRLANAGAVALNSTYDYFHSSPSYPKRLPQSNSTVYNVENGDGSQMSLCQDHSSSPAVNRGKKKSPAEQSADQNSSNSSLSKVLGISNCGEGRTTKFNSAKKSQLKAVPANNRKSKPEPMFEPHPMFHPHLPEAEMEEEIENSPLLALLETEEQRLKEEAQQKKNAPHLMFEITSSDGFHVRSDSLNKAWKAVTDGVQDARLSAGMKPVSFVGIDGLSMTALNHPAVVYLVEQLPGFKRFCHYEFKYHPPQLKEEDDEIIENPCGCARARPLCGWRKCETFSFLLSKYRTRPEYDPTAAYRENTTANKSQRRSTSLDLPMAMRFRHLRIFAKEAVGVYRSNIHGRGLFCRRDIDAGEMIIEYSGEVIRAILTDKREKRYESKAMGCYMFRKDCDHVIDSTMMGNAARFINHSCDPNCYSKIILVDNRKHIVIFAQRAIRRGEELTYDYKFPIEDVKIPCSCGSRRCRKYLN